MTTCAAAGCNARPAARGLCTTHLGLSHTKDRAVKPIVTFVNTLPESTRPRGRRSNPVTRAAVEQLKARPNQWGEYPAQTHWDDFGEIDDKRAHMRLTSIRNAARKAERAFAGGQWEAEIIDRSLYLRYLGATVTELKKPA